MKILVDADSCPADVRAVICRAAQRTATPAIFVANRRLSDIENWDHVTQALTEVEPEASDRYIISQAQPGDLVVTRDIPLAEKLVLAGIAAINDRGDRFDAATIAKRRSERDRALEFALAGLGGPARRNRGPGELKAFADCFDRELVRLLRAR